jgi:integrase
VRAPRLKIRHYTHSSTSKWVVDGWKENGKRKRVFFRTKADAETWAHHKTVEATNYGTRALAVPEELRLEAVKCSEELKPFNKSLTDAVRYYVDHLRLCAQSCVVTGLIAEFLVSRTSKGRSPKYVKDLRNRLKRFEKAFGEQNAATLTTREIDQWISGLGLGPQSQNNYRTILSSLFSYALSRGYVQSHPVMGIEKAKVVGNAPGIFTPEEMRQLLNAAQEHVPDVLGFLAIGAFAGLRMAEIERLVWNDVDLEDGFIHVGAKKAKSARRRLVKIEPNLRRWLDVAVRVRESVAPLNLRVRLLETRKAARSKKWPFNGLRHSYASYHLAHFKDAARLALEMGHTDTSMIFGHYRELVRTEEAAGYWRIEPLLSLKSKIAHPSSPSRVAASLR